MRNEVVAALTSHLVKDLPPLSPSVWRVLKNKPEEELEAYARGALTEKDAELVFRRLERLDEFGDALFSLSQAGISLITEFSIEYPHRWKEKLGDRTPSHLFVAGNVGLLRLASIGVVGSRDVNEEGIAFTQGIAREAVQNGLSVISGGARGVDEVAMRAAFDAGGYAVGISAESLTKALRKWDLESERVCLASPFAPEAGFQVANAMARNKLIYAGSEATVVVSSAFETGGTWAGATEALKQGLCPLLVRSGAKIPDGNRSLLERGGFPIEKPGDLMKVLLEAQPAQGSLL